MPTFRYTDFYSPGPDLPDQPNRAVRTRMPGGVGGGSRKATPYPDISLETIAIIECGHHGHMFKDVLLDDSVFQG